MEPAALLGAVISRLSALWRVASPVYHLARATRLRPATMRRTAARAYHTVASYPHASPPGARHHPPAPGYPAYRDIGRMTRYEGLPFRGEGWRWGRPFARGGGLRVALAKISPVAFSPVFRPTRSVTPLLFFRAALAFSAPSRISRPGVLSPNVFFTPSGSFGAACSNSASTTSSPV